MMQSEMLVPLLWFFLNNAPTYWHHQTTEGLLLVTKGAEPPWAREFASTKDKSHASLPAGESCFSCPLAGLQAKTPAECVQANAVLGTLLGNPAFWLYTQTDKKGFFFLSNHCQGDEFASAPHPEWNLENPIQSFWRSCYRVILVANPKGPLIGKVKLGRPF